MKLAFPKSVIPSYKISIWLASVCLAACSTSEPSYEQLFIGTYTGSGNEGIYTCLLNPETGELTPPTLSVKTENPSFLAIHTDENLVHTVFAVNEVSYFGIDTTGVISTFFVHVLGPWGVMGRVASRGAHPCYVSLDESGKFVLVANYTGGTIAVYRRDEKGMPGELTALVKHQGSGPDPKRQDRPHPHYIHTTRNNKFVLVADLGIDKIMIYRFDAKAGTLQSNDPPFVALDPGSGPRHLAMDESGTKVYVLNELNSTVSFFSMDPASGALTHQQTVPTLPPGFSGPSTAAEIALDAQGEILYASNRGHDSIVSFEVNKQTGRLTVLDWAATGKGPRNFSLDLTGKWLLVANQHGHTIDVFEVDHNGKKLRATSNSVEINSPVCIRFVGEAN